MDDLVGTLLRVDEKEDAQTAAETAGNWDLVAARQRRIVPAHRAGRLCREISVEVVSGSEERRRYVLSVNVVCRDHLLEEFTTGCQDVLRSIAIYGDSAPDTSAEHSVTSSRTRRLFPLRGPCVQWTKHAGQEGIRAATTAAGTYRPDVIRRSL